MRTGRFILLILMLSALFACPTSAGELPFVFHGNLGYGKIMEDNAPNGSVGFGVGAIYPLQNMPVAFGADLGFLLLGNESESYVDPYTKATVSAEAKLSAIPFTGQAYVWFPVSPRSTIYGDFGMGFYHMRWSVEGSASYQGLNVSSSASDSETDFGVNLGGGFKFSLPNSRLALGFDGKYHIVSTEGESTNLLTFMGRVYFQ